MLKDKIFLCQKEIIIDFENSQSEKDQIPINNIVPIADVETQDKFIKLSLKDILQKNYHKIYLPQDISSIDLNQESEELEKSSVAILSTTVVEVTYDYAPCCALGIEDISLKVQVDMANAIQRNNEQQ